MGRSQILYTAFAVIATYGIHSTLLLAAALLMDQRRWLHSHSLREKLWKWSAVVPCVSAVVQVVWAGSGLFWQVDIAVNADVVSSHEAGVSTPVIASVRSREETVSPSESQ